MHRTAVIALSLAIAPAYAAEHAKLSKAQIAEVKRVTASRMRDPSSATFDQITGARSSTGALNVCGLVNGKNGYGGYAGNRPFFGMFDEGGYKLVISEDAQGTFGVGEMCRKLGINLSL